MSRIGVKPVPIPENVKVEITKSEVIVEGPKGKLTTYYRPEIGVKVEGAEIITSIKKESKKSNGFWGLTRSLISNMVEGVTDGFEKKLELVGVGYRVSQAGSNGITVTVGYSHPVEFTAPEGIELKVEDNKNITVSGMDKQLVGLTAARIRKIRKPEPYKGKGVRYAGETVRRKPGKAGKVGA